jgi:predicted protein tyrosine phosphatase
MRPLATAERLTERSEVVLVLVLTDAATRRRRMNRAPHEVNEAPLILGDTRQPRAELAFVDPAHEQDRED